MLVLTLTQNASHLLRVVNGFVHQYWGIVCKAIGIQDDEIPIASQEDLDTLYQDAVVRSPIDDNCDILDVCVTATAALVDGTRYAASSTHHRRTESCAGLTHGHNGRWQALLALKPVKASRTT